MFEEAMSAREESTDHGAEVSMAAARCAAASMLPSRLREVLAMARRC